MGSSHANEMDAPGRLFDTPFPAGWARHALYSLATWTNGLAFKPADFSNAGLPIIKIAEIKTGITAQTKVTDQEFPAHVKVEGGDLLFSWSGQPETSIDVHRWSGPTGWLNQHIFRVEPRDGVDRQFFYYLLKYLRPNFVAIARNKQTTGLGHVTKRDLQAIQVGVPDVPQQQIIATALGSLDARIENLRHANATLEAIAEALFKSWFVDFDPVRAKAEGRKPDGMDAATAARFPSEFENSELGPIPRGWSASNLADLVELKYGKALKASERQPGAIPVYGSGGVTGTHSTPLVANPTIIVGRKGTVGALYWQSGPCFPIDTVFYAVPKKSLHFGYYAMRRMGLEHLNTDAAVPGLNRDNAYRQWVVLPCDEVLGVWDRIVAPLRASVDQANEYAQTLRAIRDTLLPRLISGKLRLPEAAALAEDALA